MSSLVLPPLYAILDPEQTQGRAAADALRQLLAGGAAILQLRVKTMTPRDFLELARFARAETHAHGCKLIINDRVDVALACDADGVHLGQDDLPLAAGRKLVGQKIVGISTHDIEQAQRGRAKRRRLHRLRSDVRHARRKIPATRLAAWKCSAKFALR